MNKLSDLTQAIQKACPEMDFCFYDDRDKRWHSGEEKIRLEHILRAYAERIGGIKASFLDALLCGDPNDATTAPRWNLLEDYEGQSEETKLALYNLICK